MDYHRKSIRLKGYNYSENGYYFVTVCVQDKLKLFWKKNRAGDLENNRADTSVRPYINKNYLNDIGLIMDYWLNEIPNHFKNIEIDELIIMPDHIHFILIIKNKVGVDRCVDPIKLGDIIQWFKTMATNQYLKNIKLNNWPKFNKRLWQRNYYERIIREEEEYLKRRVIIFS